MRSKLLKGIPIITCLIAGLFMASCSHVTPYYKQDYQPPQILYPDDEDLSFRLLLIGDAGEVEQNDSCLEKLTAWASKHPQKTMIAFLGDNIYPDGMPPEEDPTRNEAEHYILEQIDVIRESGARGLFIPGNHDWKQGTPGIIRQQNFIASELNREDAFFPQSGCPGPETIDIQNVRIIVLDTTLWIEKKLQPSQDCLHTDLNDALAEVKAMISSAGNRHVVFLAHNPLDTHGPHGGFFAWQDHLFPLTHLVDWLYLPLPIVGSLYPLISWNVLKNDYNLNSISYQKMIEDLEKVFIEEKPLIYASGHDHSLQVLDGGEIVKFILVSGAGSQSRLSPVSHSDNTYFAHQNVGFMAIDFLKDGSVWLYVVEPGKVEVVFFKKLVTSKT